MKKTMSHVSILSLSFLAACGPAFYYEDGYTEEWDVVTDVTYLPHENTYTSNPNAHGTLLFRADVESNSQSVQTWLNLPNGSISKANFEVDPCYFASDMIQSFGSSTQIECVDPLIGPYALTLKNTHSYPITVNVSIERNTNTMSSSSQSLYAQTFTIDPYEHLEIPLLFESN